MNKKVKIFLCKNCGRDIVGVLISSIQAWHETITKECKTCSHTLFNHLFNRYFFSHEQFLSKTIKIDKNNTSLLVLCQPSRSGSSLFLRIFDSHPQVIVRPMPFDFSELSIWPFFKDEKELHDNITSLAGISDSFSISRYNSTSGWIKGTSNTYRAAVPIDFDFYGYHAIISNSFFYRGNTFEDFFYIVLGSFFSSWINFQSKYGEKKHVLLHQTLDRPELYCRNYENFIKNFGNGKMIFMVRNIWDWINSSANVEVNIPWRVGDINAMLKYYRLYYEGAIEASDRGDGGLLVFSFDRLVADFGDYILRLIDRLDVVDWSTLYHPTANSIRILPNSSFLDCNDERVSKKALGRMHPDEVEAKYIKNEHMAEYERCVEVYREMVKRIDI